MWKSPIIALSKDKVLICQYEYKLQRYESVSDNTGTLHLLHY